MIALFSFACLLSCSNIVWVFWYLIVVVVVVVASLCYCYLATLFNDSMW